VTTPPVVLTIAGSDSGAGAGIQADLKAFAALRVFGTSAITALTAQNTVEVRGVQSVPTAFVRAQIEAVLDDFDVRAVKTGLLATAATIELVAELAADGRLPNLVVDPVMVASTGARLLDRDAERLYVERLFPQARVVTPNLREAGVLLGTELHTLADQRAAARKLAVLGPVIVVKGGHAVDDRADAAIDVVAVDGTADVVELSAPRLGTPHNHGSGCSFASAIAAGLATGRSDLDAVVEAKALVHRAIAGGAGWNLGTGHGPLDHFGWENP
jgi:hydroxymethylpyrimidine/phosphomethylpyrimidine kinase